MAGASPLAEPSLVAYFPFREGGGGSTLDLSPNHLVGTLGAPGGTANVPAWAPNGGPY